MRQSHARSDRKSNQTKTADKEKMKPGDEHQRLQPDEKKLAGIIAATIRTPYFKADGRAEGLWICQILKGIRAKVSPDQDMKPSLLGQLSREESQLKLRSHET